MDKEDLNESIETLVGQEMDIVRGYLDSAVPHLTVTRKGGDLEGVLTLEGSVAEINRGMTAVNVLINSGDLSSEVEIYAPTREIMAGKQLLIFRNK